jgi:hypothetical protein
MPRPLVLHLMENVQIGFWPDGRPKYTELALICKGDSSQFRGRLTDRWMIGDVVEDGHERGGVLTMKPTTEDLYALLRLPAEHPDQGPPGVIPLFRPLPLNVPNENAQEQGQEAKTDAKTEEDGTADTNDKK